MKLHAILGFAVAITAGSAVAADATVLDFTATDGSDVTATLDLTTSGANCCGALDVSKVKGSFPTARSPA